MTPIGTSLFLNDWELDRRWVIFVSQQIELRRRIEDWCIKVIAICEGNRDANGASFMEAVRGRQQVEEQLKRFSDWDWH